MSQKLSNFSFEGIKQFSNQRCFHKNQESRIKNFISPRSDLCTNKNWEPSKNYVSFAGGGHDNLRVFSDISP